MTKMEQVQSMVEVPINMKWSDQVEWILPETTVEKMPAKLVTDLKALGCRVFNVDGSKAPYYWVTIRLSTR